MYRTIDLRRSLASARQVVTRGVSTDSCVRSTCKTALMSALAADAESATVALIFGFSCVVHTSISTVNAVTREEGLDEPFRNQRELFSLSQPALASWPSPYPTSPAPCLRPSAFVRPSYDQFARLLLSCIELVREYTLRWQLI